MSYNVTDFLGGLFGDRPQPSATAEPEPQAGDAAGEPSGTPDFSDWVRRPDCNGRMGWEPPDLPEAARWWAEHDFDELPEPDWACSQCGGPWRDVKLGKGKRQVTANNGKTG